MQSLKWKPLTLPGGVIEALGVDIWSGSSKKVQYAIIKAGRYER